MNTELIVIATVNLQIISLVAIS